MTSIGDRENTFREALFSGGMDLDGMDALLALYRDIYPLRRSGPKPGKELKALRDDEISMRLGEGFSLLETPDLLPAEPDLSDHLESIGKILAGHSEDPDWVAQTVKRILEEPEGLSSLAEVYLKGGDGMLRAKAKSLDKANPEVVMFLIFNALKGLFLGAGHCSNEVSTDRWNRGKCPVCGGEPAVSYLAGEGGKRFLICHRCERIWRFRRLACPFCEHESPDESRFLYIEEPEYRIMSGYVCDECRSYIKTWRVEDEALGTLHPEVEDLKTPAFDAAMMSEGYRRVAPNIFGVMVGDAVPGEVVEGNRPPE
jgi:FdhE protein